MENTSVIVQETLQDLRAKSVSANNETFSNISLWQLIKDFDFFAQAFVKFPISAGYLSCFEIRKREKTRNLHSTKRYSVKCDVCRTNIAELMATRYLTPRFTEISITGYLMPVLPNLPTLGK